jgi:preprotein translocase subunit SecG
MENVLLVAYLLIVLALIAVILIQRSEGGGLGMGSANSNGLVSVRGQANLLTRTTAVLAALFFVTAIGLTILAELNRTTSDILDSAASPTGTQPATVLDALSQMGGGAETLPLPADAATTSTPAATTETAPAGADPVTTEADPGLALPITPPAESAPAQEGAATSSAPAQ